MKIENVEYEELNQKLRELKRALEAIPQTEEDLLSDGEAIMDGISNLEDLIDRELTVEVSELKLVRVFSALRYKGVLSWSQETLLSHAKDINKKHLHRLSKLKCKPREYDTAEDVITANERGQIIKLI